MQEHMHHNRRLLIALAMAGGIGAGFGTLASPAAADARVFEVKLLLGTTKTAITLNIPAEHAAQRQVKIPGLNLGRCSASVEITQASATTGGGPLLSHQADRARAVRLAAQRPRRRPPRPRTRCSASLKTSKKKKAKPSVGQPVFDSAGRLQSAQQPERARPAKTRLRHSNGVPTLTNPTLSLATLGPVPVGVPNFFINKFRIPPFLLSIYQAAGIQYGVRWEVLAAINEIETDYGRNLNVSSAGAMGWMQFIPSSWKSSASMPTATARSIRTTRSTRSSRPRATSRQRAPTRICARRSSPTTTPTGTSTRCSCGRASSAACPLT